MKESRSSLPDYLSIPAADLGKGTSVKVRILGDMMSVAVDMAESLKAEIVAANREGRGATFIIPVGPVDQYPILAEGINKERISCANVVFIGMDEYLTEEDEWLPLEHPLSFRGFLNRKFYDLLDPALAPPQEQQIFPDPRNLGAMPELIARRGGVDVCYGGIGMVGHIAFNEPIRIGAGTASSPQQNAGTAKSGDKAVPAPSMCVEEFAALPTRALDLTPETRTINAVTVGGEIGIIPQRAVTVGMKEILGARRLRLYCNRTWQSAVVRRVLHGPVTAECPASLMRLHADACVTMAEYVGEPPEIKLR
ncbi:MAG: glucosamine-6-phosphate isomerase [Verrucomicrobia bacterium]|nr:MAG: glucosamine-6-phosphate isomerase [Verrucomicrobiota bacterium]